jgi:hypothetical protein
MVCEECARLSAQYDRLKQAHETALSELRSVDENIGALGDYRKAATNANTAWREAESARLELERHQRGHRSVKVRMTEEEAEPAQPEHKAIPAGRECVHCHRSHFRPVGGICPFCGKPWDQ